MGLNNIQCREVVEDAEQFSGLGAFFDRPVHTYSTGMVTRLVYALATSGRPNILIMDEALATGDAQFQALARRRSRAMMESADILVVASHSVEFLLEVCETGVLMSQGRIQAQGAIDVILKEYESGVDG